MVFSKVEASSGENKIVLYIQPESLLPLGLNVVNIIILKVLQLVFPAIRL